MTAAVLLTAGHGTLHRAGLTDLLIDSGAKHLVDVRRFPGSRRNPDVSRDAMRVWVPQEGLAYTWEERLGGRRRVPQDQPPEVDGWWRVDAFRAYAAHTRTPEFRAALEGLLPLEATTLVMCSESLWWRCHRRLIADVLALVHGVPVLHLAHDGRVTEHEPAAGARVTPEGLRYDAPPSRSSPG